jgi:hypothetical protein
VARADLVNKTIASDGPLAHEASLDDLVLSVAAEGHHGDNWEWNARQRVAPNGSTWVIEVRAHHKVPGHSGDGPNGGDLLAIAPYLAPGMSGTGVSVVASHGPHGHTDRMVVGYTAMGPTTSQLRISLEHVGGDARNGRWLPTSTVLVGILVLVGLTGVLARRPRRKA